MVSTGSSPLSPPLPSPPPLRRSKRKRNEPPSPPPRIGTSTAKKRKVAVPPSGINVGAKTIPKKRTIKAPVLPSSLARVAPEQIAPYPSPFARLDDWSFKSSNAPECLKTAFSVQRAIGRLEFEWDSDTAFATWYRHGKNENETYVEYGDICTRPICAATWIASYGQISWDDMVSKARPIKRLRANPPRVRRAVEIFRDGEGENAEFYLAWQRIQQVKVNGRTCAVEDSDKAEFAIGPLPDYAIIEIENTVIFWFRNVSAMDFVTPEIQQRRLDIELFGVVDAEIDTQDLEAKKREEQGKEELKRRRLRWQRIWLKGISVHMDKSSHSVGHPPLPTYISEPSELHGEDVVVAIGSLWRTLNQKMGRLFSFHDYVHYTLVRGTMVDAQGYRERIQAAVHGPNDLLIPMTFARDEMFQSPPNSATFEGKVNATNGDQQAKATQPEKNANGEVGGIGHILLAVAQTRPDNKINVIILDSCPGCIKKERILRAVSRTVRKIGWLGMDKEGCPIELEQNLNLVEESKPIVPLQAGINACGIYTVLNAWMFMLGLPTADQRSRKYRPKGNESQKDTEGFLANALGMINCALAGHMDLHTIQAFFNCYGYCQLQDPDDPNVRLSDRHRTTRMNPNTLKEMIDERRAIEQTETVHEVPDPKQRYPLKDIRHVRERTGCAYSQIIHLLTNADGNAEDAILLHETETAQYSNGEEA